MIGINYALQTMSDSYWNMVEIGMKHTPMFFIGMLVAYVTKGGISDNFVAIVTLLVAILYIGVEICNAGIPYVGVICKTLFYVLLLCVFLSQLEKMSVPYLSKILAWLGKYTLELYVLHLFICALLKSPMFHLDETKGIILACCLSLILCMPIQYVINLIIKQLQK